MIGSLYIKCSPETPETPKSDFLIFYGGFEPREVSRWIRTAFFMQIHTFRPQFHHSGPPNTSIFVKIPKIKNVVANIFPTLFKKTPLAKILRPNLWAKNDPMVILSLSTFRKKVRFDCIFPIEIQLFCGKSLFHFKPSGIYFDGCLFSSECFSCYYYFLFFSTWSPSWAARSPGDGSGLVLGGPHALKYGK